jgi:NitT/TauT family transport system substrate-binding protein
VDEREAGSVSRRGFLKLAAGMTSAGLLAACAPQAAPSPTAAPAKPAEAKPAESKPAEAKQAAPAQTKTRDIQFLLDVTPYGKHAFYYAPQDHGEWPKAGFNVKFASAQGSGDAVRKIGAKAADFALADTGAVIVARGEGAMVKQTFMTHYKNLMSVLSLKEKAILKPQDMEGKKIASVAGDASLTLLPAFAKINNIDKDKINIVIMDFPSKIPNVMQGSVDGAYEFYTSWPTYVAQAKKINKEPASMLYADFGLDVYNNGIVAHDDTLKDGAMVKEFLAALAEGIKWSVENPDAANEFTLKYNPALDKAVARQELQVAIDHLMVDEVKQNGLGTMSQDKMRKTWELVTQNFTLKQNVSFDAFWTTEFVPKGVIPRA